MAWERTIITIAGEAVDGSVRRGETVEATVPWRADVAPGTEVGLDDGRYMVSAARDPGGRHEILELTLEPTVAPSSHGKRPVRPRDKNERLAAIRETIRSLDPDDAAHFTEDGKPDANVLSDRLGWRVTARERDEAQGALSNDEA